MQQARRCPGELDEQVGEDDGDGEAFGADSLAALPQRRQREHVDLVVDAARRR
eukprot:SAG31_NODE_2213_length_6174_cov_4.236214_4_plen_53_part_00